MSAFDLDGFVPPRTRNWALAVPAGRKVPRSVSRGVPGACVTAPRYRVAVARLRDALVAVALREPRTELLSEKGTCLAFRARSLVLGFPDLISVRLEPLGGDGASLAIFARARYGLSDLGVNRRRLLRWLDALEGELRP